MNKIDELVKCPVCGKKPKIKWQFDPGGAYVKIQCKPLFHKPHLEVECGAASPDWALEKAKNKWNIDSWLYQV